MTRANGCVDLSFFFSPILTAFSPGPSDASLREVRADSNRDSIADVFVAHLKSRRAKEWLGTTVKVQE